MNAFSIVFRREIQERRLLFLAALLLGLIPLVLPWVPGLESGHPSDLRQAAAVGLMVVTSLALAVALGATGIAGDLIAGRMSFYFSRPLPAWTIWAGKLAAMLALVLCTAFLVVLPTLLLDGFSGAGFVPIGSRGLDLFSGRGSLLPWGFAIALVLLGAHFLAVAIRSRSPWLALDLTGMVALAGGVAAIYRSTLREGFRQVSLYSSLPGDRTTLFGWLFGGFGLALVLALLLASALQVSRGRIDPRRGHRVQSLVFWSLAAVALAGLAGVARWAVAVTPNDLTEIELARAAPVGPWLALLGPARHRPGLESMLLVDPESGRFVRTRAALVPNRTPEIKFTGDGRLAYWFEPQDLAGSALELMTLALRDPGARPLPTGAVFAVGQTGNSLDFLLSPDGRRLAVFLDRRLTVEDLPTHKLLVAQSVDDEDPYYSRTLHFSGADRLRLDVLNQYESAVPNLQRQSRYLEQLAERERVRVSFYEADLATGKVARSGSVDSSLGIAWWERSPDGERGVLLGRDSTEVRDGRSGALISSLSGRTSFARFVPGGLVLVQNTEEGREVLLCDPDGRRVRARLTLPGKGLITLQDGMAGADPLQLFARPRLGGSASEAGAVWKRWRIAVERGAFEPLADRTLYLIGGRTQWNLDALRRVDGSVMFNSFGERIQVQLRAGR